MALLGFLFGQKALPQSAEYKAFTRRYDRIVEATELSSVIGGLSPAAEHGLEQAWKQYQDGLGGWKTRATWKLLELSQTIRNSLTVQQRDETLVAILVDQSGSMRGPKILMTAMAADVLQATLGGIGIRCEVLGFTTVGWHGGRSRRMWRWIGRPRNPGRLCDLLHVIYKDGADERASTDGWQFRQMLRPDLPKENVDGEALEWAASRLRAYPQKQKILLIVSDGAPVDDSTIMANDVEYLPRHLRSVIQNIVARGDIKICALGLAHDVEQYYATCERIEVPDDLPEAIAVLCERVLVPTIVEQSNPA
jgi:cobaltochelatase CobT